VYISGESGSGKELAARLVHENGARRTQPFVPVNCGAIAETLMESELFGYRKGAFTGANEDRNGFFQAAHGGTLFLDEVAELPLHTQVLLLRAIQERRVRKVGSTQEEPADARIICATNQSLAGMVEAGRFRRDLYYRLNVVELNMPPLRECREDIPLIAVNILQRLAAQNGVAAPRLSEAALAELMAYDFPGNVRELENIMERALALSQAAELGPEELALHRITPEGDEEEAGTAAGAQPTAQTIDAPLPAYLDRLERDAILQALAKTGFNRTAAARLLGITFRQLRYRMQRLGIKDENR
jgi:two-component system response regulator PilR (NtrC family)